MFKVGDVLNDDDEEFIERPESVRCLKPLTVNVFELLLITVGVTNPEGAVVGLFSMGLFSFVFGSERDADAARRRNAANIIQWLYLEMKHKSTRK